MSVAPADTNTPTRVDAAPTPPPPPQQSARDFVRQATDPVTGAVDTKKLAGWVADARQVSPQAASDADAAIESQLGPGDAGRYNADLSAALQRQQRGPTDHSATGAAQSPVSAGQRVLRDNPILEVQWRSTTSPVTGKGGFTGSLQDRLAQTDVNTRFPVAPPPANSIASNAPGVNTLNGNAARDVIANEFAARGQLVGTEQYRQTSLGGRRVDVVGMQPGPRPEENRLIEVESKLGRASASKDTLLQVDKDVERLAGNRAVRGLGEGLETAGKVFRPIGLAVDAAQLGVAFHEDGNSFGDNTQHAVGSLAGGAAGAWAGAEAGAAIGSLGGPVGTVVGGLVGGAIGGIVGSGIGSKAVDAIKSLF